MTIATAARADQIARELITRQRDYEREVREAAEEGFRPHYCIHGTNLWTDYDPICGPCEDGQFTQYSTPRQVRSYARLLAEGEEAEKARQTKAVTAMIDSIIEMHRAKGQVIGTPRIYRDGAAAVVIIRSPEWERIIEIDADARPTFRTLA